jgi:1,4-alpha-glucan branching enzyme
MESAHGEGREKMPAIFSLMLHSHIPYCRKSGVWPAGEEWLFEAMNETYIPLLLVLRQFALDRIRPRIMIGVVPVLAEQLADDYMKDRFARYMEDKIERARRDVERLRADPGRGRVAQYWLDRFQTHYHHYRNDFYRDILGTLKWLQDEGVIELVASAATHGFLPLLERDSSIYAQVRVGIETYRKYFGRGPQGFWIPECAYRPGQWSSEEKRARKGIDEWLENEGIKYFFVEGVGITRAEFVENRHGEAGPTPDRGYRLPSGVAVFGRNEATGKQVWSSAAGYPGDPNYLEFHQKDPESGLHYWRVTGKPEKDVYSPDQARRKAEEHADHFVSLLREEEKRSRGHIQEAPALIVSPYDCELFGHWWHEGPIWIDRLFRRLNLEREIQYLSLSEVLDRHGSTFSSIRMGPSTWGLNADFTVWQNAEHGWIWPYINTCAREMEQVLVFLDGQGRSADDRGRRILRQMARELLLMQGSDWPFLLFTTQAKEYANQRFHRHHQRFQKLFWASKDLSDLTRMKDQELRDMEDVDSIWPDIDYDLFRSRS